MADWGNIGAGAAGGLDDLFTRMRLEEQVANQTAAQKESARHNVAAEGLQSRTLEENAAIRRQSAADLATQRSNAETNMQRDDLRAAISQLPGGTEISPETRQSAIKLHAAAPERFDEQSAPDRQAVAQGVPESLAQNDPTATRIKLRPTPQELTNAERLQLQQLRDEKNAGIAQHRERRLTDNPPISIIANPDVPGGTLIVTRGSAIGQPGPQTSAARTKELDTEVGFDALENLKSLFDRNPDIGGPVEGRLRTIGQQIPGVPVNKDFTDLESATNAFKSQVIKAITGAQMNKQEEARILGQIPLITDKPEVWLSRYEQTKKNLEFISGELKQQRQGPRGQQPATTPTGAPAGTPAARRYNPVTGKIE